MKSIRGMQISFLLCMLVVLVYLSEQQQEQTQQTSTSLFESELTNIHELELYEIFLNNKCNLPPTPNKLAIVTMTRLRVIGENDLKEGIEFFKEYLKHYAEMECDLFDSIYFIWNNDKSPEEYPTLLDRKSHWKKNIYFIQTKFNSLDHRFVIPPWVQEEVLMTLDDDAVIDCESLKKTFTQWQSHIVAGLGPFAALQISGRSMEYMHAEDKFVYQFASKSYASITLTNIGIAPRHFYDLYYANISEFHTMRKIISEYLNCEDIGLNFMIGYIYPEIRPTVLRGIDAKTKSFTVEINKSPRHYEKRHDCVNKFSQILGENTLTYNLIDKKEEYEKTKEDPLRKYYCMLALKRAIMEQEYFNYDHYYNFIKKIEVYNSTELSTELMSQINADNYILSLEKEQRDELIKTNRLSLNYRSKRVEREKTKEITQRNKEIIDQQAIIVKETEEKKVLTENFNKLNEQFEILKIAFIITYVILVLVLVWKMIECFRSYRRSINHTIKGEKVMESEIRELKLTVSDKINDDEK